MQKKLGQKDIFLNSDLIDLRNEAHISKLHNTLLEDSKFLNVCRKSIKFELSSVDDYKTQIFLSTVSSIKALNNSYKNALLGVQTLNKNIESKTLAQTIHMFEFLTYAAFKQYLYRSLKMTQTRAVHRSMTDKRRVSYKADVLSNSGTANSQQRLETFESSVGYKGRLFSKAQDGYSAEWLFRFTSLALYSFIRPIFQEEIQELIGKTAYKKLSILMYSKISRSNPTTTVSGVVFRDLELFQACYLYHLDSFGHTFSIPDNKESPKNYTLDWSDLSLTKGDSLLDSYLIEKYNLTPEKLRRVKEGFKSYYNLFLRNIFLSSGFLKLTNTGKLEQSALGEELMTSVEADLVSTKSINDSLEHSNVFQLEIWDVNSGRTIQRTGGQAQKLSPENYEKDLYVDRELAFLNNNFQRAV